MKLRYRSLWGDWLFVWIVLLVTGAGVFTVYDVFDGAVGAALRRPSEFLLAWVVNAVLFVVVLAGIPIWWRWRRRTHADRSDPRRPW